MHVTTTWHLFIPWFPVGLLMFFKGVLVVVLYNVLVFQFRDVLSTCVYMFICLLASVDQVSVALYVHSIRIHVHTMISIYQTVVIVQGLVCKFVTYIYLSCNMYHSFDTKTNNQFCLVSELSIVSPLGLQSLSPKFFLLMFND